MENPCGATERHPPFGITCRLTQVNAPHHNFGQAGSLLDLPTSEGWKAELILVLVIYRHGLPVCRQSPIYDSKYYNHSIATQSTTTTR